VLLNLLRGAGMPGLRGIPPVREGRFVRPLIESSRKEIEGYANLHQVPFVTDSSNLKTSYLRNRIRLHLLPLLRDEYNPQVMETLAAIASILAAEEELLESMASSHLSSALLQREEGRVALSVSALSQESLALQRRILIEAARMASPSSHLPLSHRHIFALQDLLRAQNGSQLTLAKGMVATKDYGRLIIAQRKESPPAAWEYPLAINGLIGVPEAKVGLHTKIQRRQEVHLGDSSPLRAFLDMDRMDPPLTVRNRRPGDRFHPLGAAGEKKLKEFLIDAKVSRGQRDQIPLLVSKGEIVWVVGYRIHERYQVREETQKVLAVEVIPDE
jgi:tRNA(Ile)-lysidine synthase